MRKQSLLRKGVRVSRDRLRRLRARGIRKSARRTMTVDAPRTQAAQPNFVRFAGTSLLCTAVDQLLAALLFWALRKPMADLAFLRILLSSTLARCVSLSLNYALNRHLVFMPEDPGDRLPRKRESLPRYLALAACVLGLSTLGVFIANELWQVEEWQAKLVVDFLLFFLNYTCQRRWVFRQEVSVPVRHKSR